ncbi:hypothetical protein ACOI1H_23220 [Loktanella sp. DJP18]|uniref:hypothetical protein n=1 Tax=Loktanella sp. DJP18 TaxID=3409788 RepID=UPI003BB53EF8
MKITLRTTFTINNGDDQVRDLEVEIPTGKDPLTLSSFERMSLAADTLIDRGQIMVSGACLTMQDAVAA